MALSDAARAHIVYLVDYHTKAGVGHPPDQLTSDLLSRYHADWGWVSQIKFAEDFRDSPLLTLLRVLLVA